MNNKKLLFVVLLLIPFSLCSYHIYDNTKTESIYVSVLVNNEVIKMELNDYIIGVVAAEMPASFNYEALKAQAVASRTFTLKKISNNENYIFKGSKSDQGYITNDEMKDNWLEKCDYYLERIKKAVIETKNEVITYNGDLIKAYYFSMSNGKTENAMYVFNETEDYLQGSSSDVELTSKKMEQHIELSKDDFCAKLSIINCQNITINDIKKTPSERIESLEINDKTYSGIIVRQKFGLRSTDFNIEITDKVLITTKGYGHGVGMSQYGAHYMAEAGSTYREILINYYPKTKIEEF